MDFFLVSTIPTHCNLITNFYGFFINCFLRANYSYYNFISVILIVINSKFNVFSDWKQRISYQNENLNLFKDYYAACC